ncbi:hypothetical protein AVEN_46782-1 [Araneus ventricosus]|uniref:RNase H type-1 domain-containing protein n=1 Tax=Araneus ventricosus TaxID=182803 RepID=A0A4Y2CXE4_ARAVE|nr:hypothetical protein AVEN_46782-1 [Araneus ventricosus]
MIISMQTVNTCILPDSPARIPSHVNIQGNEIADALAKAGADDASVPSAPLTYLELFSRSKIRNKTIWVIPPVHHWTNLFNSARQNKGLVHGASSRILFSHQSLKRTLFEICVPSILEKGNNHWTIVKLSDANASGMLSDGVIILHVTHTARKTQELLQKFKWEVWSHSPTA